MTPSFEIRIPIAPTPGFYSNVRLAALSLARLGEPYASAPLIVSVGYEADLEAVRAANAWSRDYPVQWYAVPRRVWSQGGYEAGAPAERFPPTLERDLVVHCDADVCVAGRFDTVLAAVDGPGPRIAGMMAHQSPFAWDPAVNDATWRGLLDGCGLAHQPLDHHYSMASPDRCGRCPAYFNAGFMVLNHAAWSAIGALADRYTREVRPLLEHAYYAPQIGISMAVAAGGMQVTPLPLSHNCPNTDVVLQHGLQRVEDIAVFHYQRRDGFDRHSFLCEEAAFEAFRTGPLEGEVDRAFRRHVLSFDQPFYAP